MQDAFNLAWKVAFVVKGHAGPGLLDSYTPERAPVGKQIVARANQSRKDYAGAAGVVRPATATTRSRDGLAKLKEPSPEGVARRERLYEALELKNTEFNAHGVELNQRYDLRAPSSPTRPPATRSGRGTASSTCRPPPGPAPNSRTPGSSAPTGSRVSTLDVTGKGQMTLLTGLRRAGLEARGAEAGPAVPAHRRGRRAGHHRPLRLLARRPGDPRGRRAPGPPRRLRRLAAERRRSGTTTEALRQLRDALDAVLAQPRRSRRCSRRAQYSTQAVPITVPQSARRCRLTRSERTLDDRTRPYTSVWSDLAQVEFSQGFLQAGPYRTRYLHAGDDSKPALLMLHGITGHAEAYVRNLAAHAEHFSVWAIDFIGHGYSSKPDHPLEIQHYVDQVNHVLDALGVEKAYFTGESLGGWVTAQLRHRPPGAGRADRAQHHGRHHGQPEGDGAALHAVHGGGEGPVAGSGSRPAWSG